VYHGSSLLEVLAGTIDKDGKTSKVLANDDTGTDELVGKELVSTGAVKELGSTRTVEVVDVSRQVLDDSVGAAEVFDSVVGTTTDVVMLADVGPVEVETEEEDSAVEAEDDSMLLDEDDVDAELVKVTDFDVDELVEVGIGFGDAVEVSTTVIGTVMSITE
jgi:hypothetical protein